MKEKLKALVMMQLKDKIDLSFMATTKKKIAKLVFSVLGLVAITAVIYLLFYLAKLLNIFSLINIVPTSVMVVIFIVMFTLSIITCTYSLMKNLYFSTDNQVLLTLPVSSNLVFASKIIVFYLYELVKNLYFLFPLFLAYGLISALPIYYYIWLVFCFLFVSALPVSIGALLSIIAMYITIVLRNVAWLKWIVFTLCVAACVFVAVTLINMIPENIDLVGSWGTMYWDVQDFLSNVYNSAVPFTAIVVMMVGTLSGLVPIIFSVNTIITFVLVLATIVLCLSLAFIITKPLFCKMASKPFEYKKVINDKQKINKKRSSFLSLVKKEATITFRNHEDSYTFLGVALAMPILILLLNTIFGAMSTRLLGDYMIVCFNLLMILLISLASNGRMASAFSREGACGYLVKTRPVSSHKSMLAKMLVPTCLICVSIVASICIFRFMNNLAILDSIFLCGISLCVYISHMLWSVEMDIMNPQHAQYASTGTHPNNPNETKSSIAMFALAAAFAGIGLFLCMEDASIAWFKVCLIAVIFLVYRIWSFYSKVKYLYKEK